MNKPILVLRQSSVLPYRLTQGTVEVMLITSIKRQQWIIPKGWIAPGLSAADSAAKEAWEEAGVTGRVLTPAIATYTAQKWGYPCRRDVFLLHVETALEDWLEAKQRKRQWLSLTEATKHVKGKALKRLFTKLQADPDLFQQDE
ncbi:MAG: NUDIX hydrolase [Verrucomicrobia bacterium]|nr:NUDIX hydrolase [Leptolyngbya sp. ES-bin-22]